MTQQQALDILKTGANVFLTGEPGSGKTHTLNQYVAYLRSHKIEPAITASTGIAATHIGGMTLHSWSGIGIRSAFSYQDIETIADAKHAARTIGKSKVLIIDEISMLNGKVFSAVEAICRRVHHSDLPFGGMQVVLVGDFFQLPPIKQFSTTSDNKSFDFAFQSEAWMAMDPICCYLTEQYRQNDNEFVSILSAIRANAIQDKHIAHIQRRMSEYVDIPKNTTKLFAHNVDVDRFNQDALKKLPDETKSFVMSERGQRSFIETLKRGCLSPANLELKIDAVVMFTKNNLQEGFVNGTVGKVTGFCKKSGYPIIQTNKGLIITAEPMDWVIEENGKKRAMITQVPLRLAWAITIHKSQGMSLDAAAMDLGQVFEFGQGYVALSRLRNLSGLYLLGYNEKAFCVHPEIFSGDKLFFGQSKKTEADFCDISPEELQNRFIKFIVRCGGVIKEKISVKSHKKIKDKKEKYTTRDETFALFKQEKSLEQIAEERGLALGTIISHFEELYLENRLSKENIISLLSTELIENLPTIHAVFFELKTDKLTPVFKQLGGDFSFEDLRLARLIMTSD